MSKEEKAFNMERLKNQSLNKSCKTITLKTTNIFCSAFPGKIVFGNISKQSYSKQNYFEFLSFELFYLYISIVNIIKTFISNENNLPSKNLILKLNEDVSYLWSISKTNEEQKCIELILEFKEEILYKIVFNLDQVNDFVNALSEIILPALCLEIIQRQFFDFISNQEISIIVGLDNQKGLLILNEFKKMNNIDIDQIEELNIIEIIIYYRELIIIYKKIKSLINPISDRIEALLST